MSQPLLLSVRGQARRTIAPDHLTLQAGISVTAASKADVLALARAVQRRVLGALTDLGGAVLSVDSEAAGLTWSMGSVSTHEEHDFDKATGHHGPTGRVLAFGSVVITLRDLTRVAELSAAMASIEQLHVTGADWHVDRDNPAWREVRAEAIAAAIEKARDYAAALGGTVTRVEHVADAGLLVPGEAPFVGHASMSARTASSSGGVETPALDPVPQEIDAIVEARVVASVPAIS